MKQSMTSMERKITIAMKNSMSSLYFFICSIAFSFSAALFVYFIFQVFFISIREGIPSLTNVLAIQVGVVSPGSVKVIQEIVHSCSKGKGTVDILTLKEVSEEYEL